MLTVGKVYGMTIIPLNRFDLIACLEQVATEKDVSTEELLDEVIIEFLETVAIMKLKEETIAFEQLHSQLVKQHFGEYVAIYQGVLVDHDPDITALRRRIRAKFGQTPVLLREVTQDAKLPELVIRSPRLVR